MIKNRLFRYISISQSPKRSLLLITSDFSEAEVFYFASLIHLRFAHIYPFRDGNGRTARLIEKWSITEKLGRDSWKIPLEENYKVNQAKYYETINLGVNFYELNDMTSA